LLFGKVREGPGDVGERTVDKVNVVHKKRKQNLMDFTDTLAGLQKGGREENCAR